MVSLEITVQIVGQVLRSSAFWVIVGALWLARWTLGVLLPLGLTTESTHQLAATYELAFTGGAVVATLTAARLARFDVILRQIHPISRTLTEWAACLASAALCALALVGPAHALRVWQLPEFAAQASIPAGIAALGHLSSMLVCALRIPVRDRVVPLACAAAAGLALPGLIVGESTWSASLLTLLDSSATLRRSFEFTREHALWTSAAGPTLGWVLCAAALAAPGGRPSPSARGPASIPPDSPHALRDSR